MTVAPVKSKMLFFLISIAVLGSRWPGHDSEDIKNLRRNMKSSNPTDFWGGVSSLFYGHIPDFYPGWESILLIFQLTSACVGLFLILKTVFQNKGFSPVTWVLVIILLELSTLITRDGLMLSLFLLSCGLFFRAKANQNVFRFVYVSSASFFLFFAASLRPWVSPAIAFTLAFMFWRLVQAKKIKMGALATVFLALLFVFLSITFEVQSKKYLGLNRSYPEQQVFLMDLSASACWSTDQTLVSESAEALSYFYQDTQIPNSFCNSFRPSNWVHLFHRDMINGSQPKFRLLSESDERMYQEVKSIWLNSILHHPVDYIQNKLMYSSQLLFGGDTREIQLLSYIHDQQSSRSASFMYFSSFILLPLDLAVSLHLFSPIFILLILLFVLLRSRKLSKKYSLLRMILGVLLFQSLWLMCTVVAYIGDTARFFYTCGALSLLIIHLNYSVQSRSVVQAQSNSSVVSQDKEYI